MVENHTTERRRPRGLVLIAIAAVAILVIGGAIVFGVTQMTGSGNDAAPEPTGTATEEPTSTDADGGGAGENGADVSSEDANGNAQGDEMQLGTNQVLPRPMGGQEAIDELGDNIKFVAERNDKTVDELKEFLLRNESARVSKNGLIAIP